MIRSRRWLIVVAVATFLGTLLVSFPARLAFHWALPASVQASDIEGTIWSGRAASVLVNGVYLTDVSWKMYPARLFNGQIAYAIKAEPVPGFINTNAAIGLGGRVTLTALDGALPVSLIAGIVGMQGASGTVRLQFDELVLQDRLPIVAKGSVVADNLVVPLVDRNSIGGYRAEFTTDDDGINASIEDTDGVVDLAGSLHVAADRNFRFLGKVAAKPETPDNLRNQLRFLGSPDARGQYEIRFEGKL